MEGLPLKYQNFSNNYKINTRKILVESSKGQLDKMRKREMSDKNRSRYMKLQAGSVIFASITLIIAALAEINDSFRTFYFRFKNVFRNVRVVSEER